MAEYYPVDFPGTTGLTPSVTSYKKLSDGTGVTPVPAITAIDDTLGFFKMEKPSGISEAMSVIIDGGDSITDTASRYKKGFISPNDFVNGFNVVQINGTSQTAGDIVGKIGTIPSLDGAVATIGGAIAKLADNNDGADFRAATDSLHTLTAAVVSGVPTNVTASSSTLTIGTQISGSYLDTLLNNAIHWVTAPVAVNGLSEYFDFALGAGKGNSVYINGRFQAGASRYCTVAAWNWITSTFDALSDTLTNMINNNTDLDYNYTLLATHTSPSGEVRIRFLSPSTTTGDRLYIDQIIVRSVIAGASTAEIADAVYNKMKYTVHDGIWYDSASPTTGTIVGVNGIEGNPVNSFEDAMVLAGLVGTRRINMIADSSMTLTQPVVNFRIIGKGIVALNGQDTSDTIFQNLELISGTTLGEDQDFNECNFGTVTLNSCHLHECTFRDAVTVSSGSMLIITNGIDASAEALTAPEFVFEANTTIGFRSWHGGLKISGMSDGCYAKIDGSYRLVIGSDCTGGDIVMRGFACSPTDEVVDGFQGTISQTQSYCQSNTVLADVTKINGNDLTDGTVSLKFKNIELEGELGTNGLVIRNGAYIDALESDSITSPEMKVIRAALAGKMVKSGSTITFYEEDGTTPSFAVSISNAERIPI
jgi:hypothetical protein